MCASARDGRSRRVAVVGGGPAGVVSCRFLAEAGHQPTVFEAGSELGGIWAPEPLNKVVYRGLVTNIPTTAMQSFDLDFPPELPSYVKAADLGRYVVDYAEHFCLRQFVRMGMRVTHVEPLRSEEEEARGEAAWRVQWTSQHRGDAGGSAGGAECLEEEFDAVVVASGHYDQPYLPEVPGQAAWLAAAPRPGARSASHAREYDDPGSYAGRVVMVVGGRSSAVDIARELRSVARWVYVLEKGCQAARTVGCCTHVPLGTELDIDGQLLVGGQSVGGPPVEDIILATGYTYSFPFLDAEHIGLDFGAVGRYVAPLYMHVLHARRPSLGFVGVPLAVPCPIPLFEAQARFLAARFRHNESTVAEREAWVAERRAVVGDRSQDMHFLSGGAWAYMAELTRMSGLGAAEFEVYSRRLAVVQELYQDRCSKRQELPWDDDWYRRCEYSVDWSTGAWQVSAGQDAPAAAT